MATPATRAGLIDAATLALAEDGVLAASLVAITRRADLKNRGAVHYHFGGRAGWRGRCCLTIMSELVEQDPATQSPALADALTRTGGYEVYDLLARRMPPMDDALRSERLALLTSFVLGAVARRSRAGEGGRPQLPRDRFVDHLVDLGTAMMTARVR